MWIAEKPNGKFWQERVTDPLTGKSRLLSAKILKDTPQGRKAARQKLEAKLFSQKPVPVGREKLSWLVEKYEANMDADVKNGDLRESTALRNKNSAHTMLKVLDDVYLDQMTAGYVKRKLGESGRDNTGKNELIKRFKTMLRWAYSNDLITDRSVIDKLTKYSEPSEREKIKDKYLEADEAEKLIAGMQVPRWSVLTEFLLLSGLRIGEAIALESSDIGREYIHVTKTWNPVIKSLGPTKTDGSTRDVFIQPELRLCILKVRKTMLEQSRIFQYTPTTHFFEGPDGDRVDYDAYRKYLRENCEAILGREGVTPHITRHTHTSLLAAAGVPLDVISRRLGHSSSTITRNIYFHVTKELKVKDNAAVDQVTLLG